MTVVALVGPDGAGKTTIARELEQQLPHRTKYLYMGGTHDHSNLKLPTTYVCISLRRWHDSVKSNLKDNIQNRKPSRSEFQRGVVFILNLLFIVTSLVDDWLRQIIVMIYQLRGFVVVLDRYTLLHHRVYTVGAAKETLPLGTRFHTFVLEHFYLLPDLVIYLDASPEVMFARKGERSVKILRDLRQRYLSLADSIPNFVIIDANLPQEDVVQEAVKIITNFCSTQLLHGKSE